MKTVNFKLKALSAMVAAGMMMTAGAASAQVVGGGATLPEPLYNSVFIPALTGFDDYIGVGSGAGKRAFFNNDATELGLASGITVDYVGSDSVVTSGEVSGYNELAFGGLIQIPSVLTSVTVPYNITGVTNLDLSSEQLALIFSGEVTTWNDPLLGLGLPATPVRPITVVYRPDGSGTTEIFARHLNNRAPTDFPAVSNEFWKALGLASADDLPNNFIPSTSVVGGESFTGSEGVPHVVYGTPGAIGYVSPDWSEEGDNTKVASINGVQPTSTNVQAALTGVNPPPIPQRGNPLAWAISLPNPANGYSIVASTNYILSQCYQNSDDNDNIRSLLANQYGSTVWDLDIVNHGFVPLPALWKTTIFNTFHDQSNNLELAVDHPAECTPGRGRPS